MRNQIYPGFAPKVKLKQSNHKRCKPRHRHHPCNHDHDYAADEMQFMGAIEAWKTKTGRQFPRWVEVLNILKSIGYTQAEAEKKQ